MKIQIKRITAALGQADPWAALSYEFPTLGEILDRYSVAKGLSRFDVRDELVDLYRRYVNEWRLTPFGL
jgi:hypothetical protein